MERVLHTYFRSSASYEWHLLCPARMPVPLYMTTRFGARYLQPWIRFRSSFSHSRLNASGPMADLALSDQREQSLVVLRCR